MTTSDQSSITCIEPDCGRDFYLSSGEIEFYVQRDFDLPKRCQPCRSARKAGKTALLVEKAQPPTYNGDPTSITCSNCGRESTVPFRPVPNRDVYCKLCWEGVKNVVTILA